SREVSRWWAHSQVLSNAYLAVPLKVRGVLSLLLRVSICSPASAAATRRWLGRPSTGSGGLSAVNGRVYPRPGSDPASLTTTSVAVGDVVDRDVAGRGRQGSHTGTLDITATNGKRCDGDCHQTDGHDQCA